MYLITSSRRSCSKSTSISGGSLRFSERKREKSSFCSTGAIGVMPRKWERLCETGSDGNADLAHMAARLKVPECVGQFFERKGAVDHRPDTVRVDRANHVDLITPTAHRYGLQLQALGLDDGEGHCVDIEAAHGTDDGNVAAG